MWKYGYNHSPLSLLQKSVKHVRDRNIEMLLVRKASGPYWPHLLKSKVKQHWLKVDFLKWKDEDDDEADAEAGGEDKYSDVSTGFQFCNAFNFVHSFLLSMFRYVLEYISKSQIVFEKHNFLCLGLISIHFQKLEGWRKSRSLVCNELSKSAYALFLDGTGFKSILIIKKGAPMFGTLLRD